MLNYGGIMDLDIEKQLAYEKECCTKVPEDLKNKAAQCLRDELKKQESPFHMSLYHAIAYCLRSNTRKKLGLDWMDYFDYILSRFGYKYSSFHFNIGMAIRKFLRENGFGEKELGIENLYYIYVDLIERAIRI